jgi:CBS domain containing-hemolysin-like protein
MSLTVLAVLLLLILVTALYVAAEFAAVSVRRSRIQQRAEDGDWLARRLLPHIADPHRLDHYIATSQVGITISSLVLGAYGQAKLAPLLVPVFEGVGGMQVAAAESAAAAVVLVFLTAGHMILGELVPKSLALQ